MKKLLVTLAIVMVVGLCCFLVACGTDDNVEPKSKDCTHNWKAATCTEPQTCTLCGATEGEPVGHQWAEATCSAPKTCSVCGRTEGEALAHNVPQTSVLAPTCTSAGSVYGECTVCHNNIEVESIRPLGHTQVQGKCERCGEDQNNLYVAISRDKTYLNKVSTAASNASNYYSRAVDAFTASYYDYDDKIYYSQSYIQKMASNFADIYNNSVFARLIWDTDEYNYPNYIYSSLINTYNQMKDATFYKNYYANKSYANTYAYLNGISDYLTTYLTAVKYLAEYEQDKIVNGPYLSDKELLPADNVCYYTAKDDEPFYISANSNLKLYIETFNRDNVKTNYTVVVYDGENSYEEDLTGVGAGVHTVTFNNCVLNENSVVYVGVFDSAEDLLKVYTLMTR